MISNAAFAQLMQQINLPSAAAEYDRFALYCTQLQEWNQRMNLTAITDDEGVAEKHFADSLLPLTMVQLPAGASLVDVGSGAGFPGLPMALARRSPGHLPRQPAKAAHLFSAAYADAGGPSRDPPRQSRGRRAG